MQNHPKYHPNWKHPIENRAYALDAVRFNSRFLGNIHQSLRSDKEIVLIAVSHRMGRTYMHTNCLDEGKSK